MKRILALLMALTLVFALAGCGSTEKPAEAPAVETPAAEVPAEAPVVETPAVEEPAGDDLVIGVVLKTLASEYWQYVGAGVTDAEKDFGVKVHLVGPNAESDIEGQVSMIDDLISQDVDAIVVAPNEVNAAITALEAAIAKDIPVLFVDTDADLTGKSSFVGTGNFAAAQLGGDHIGKAVGSGGTAVIIRGRPYP